jgi:hypothetical protein
LGDSFFTTEITEEFRFLISGCRWVESGGVRGGKAGPLRLRSGQAFAVLRMTMQIVIGAFMAAIRLSTSFIEGVFLSRDDFAFYSP